VKKSGMRQGKERTNGTEVQDEECEGKKRKHERHKRIRFARWVGKEKEFSMERKGNERGKRLLNVWGVAKKGICGKYWKGRKKGKSSNCI
jgi:hypothetical protein